MLWQCTAVVQTGDSGDEDSVLNLRWPRNFIIARGSEQKQNIKLKKYLLSPGMESKISISQDSLIYHSSTLAQVIVGISCVFVWSTTVLKDWLYLPIIKIRPVVYEKHWSGSQIRISIRITPKFELGLPMIITSVLTKFHQNPTSSLWEILLTNKQANKQTHEGDCNIPLFAG